jgi:N6-adenosine-specific RNA methylase IME4
MVVQRLREAERALARASRANQAKLIVDVATAQLVFAKRQKLGEDVIAYAFEIKTHALVRLGELLADVDMAVGGRPLKTGTPKEPVLPTLADLGVDKKTSAIAQRLAAFPPETREAIARRETTIAQAIRLQHRETMHAVPLPPGQYRVVYADPPWHYGNSGVINDADGYGRAARRYPSMTIAELCALDVKGRVADHAVLFLWVTSPLLAECWPVIAAWGFTYKASIVWDKVGHNYGSYVSVRHELLLICTRGSCLPDHPTPMPDSVVTIPRSTVHSEKPREFRALIDRLYDGGAESKIELFARDVIAGWSVWGNEIVAFGTDQTVPSFRIRNRRPEPAAVVDREVL